MISPIVLTLAPGVELFLVRVPAGEFLMGSVLDDAQASSEEKPQHAVFLDAFAIGRYEVTVAQFSAFVRATGYRTAAEREGNGWVYVSSSEGWKELPGTDWQHPRGPGSDVRAKADHPVTQVSWDDAITFCAWASEVTGCPVRLPTEAQWEKAARGTDGRHYPWGNEMDVARRCNCYESQVHDTTPVGHYSALGGDSPYGCADMAGNVWEWTLDWYAEDYYRFSPPRNPTGPANGTARVLHGGSWFDGAGGVRAASRGREDPHSRGILRGFRVCSSPI